MSSIDKRITAIAFLTALLFCCNFSLAGEQAPTSDRDEMFIHHKDGRVQGFLKSLIVSMRLSDVDESGNSTGKFIIQEVQTEDSIYRIPVSSIDSISFVKPTTVYNEDVIDIRLTLRDYVIGAVDSTLLLDKSVPENLLPQKGDVIGTYDLPDILPYGFKGIVDSISRNEDNNIAVKCHDVPLTDVVKRLYAVTSSYSVDESSEDRKMKSGKGRSKVSHSFNLGPIPLKVPLEVVRHLMNPFNVGNSIEVTVWPKIKTLTTVVVDENIGMAAHIDVTCDYEMTETINIASQLSWDKDLPFLGKPMYFDLGYGFRLYLDGGLKLGLEGKTVQKHVFSQDFKHDMSIDFYSASPTSSHTKSRFTMGETDYTPTEVYGEVRGKFGTYMEVGLTWLCKELVSAGARAEVGLNLSVNSGYDVDQLNRYQQYEWFYESLKNGSYIELGGYWGVYGVGSLLMLGGSIGEDFNAGSPIYSNYYMPKFKSVSGDRSDETSCLVEIELEEPSIVPFTIGFDLKDTDGNLIEKYIHSKPFVEGCGYNTLSRSISGIDKTKAYTIVPKVNYFGIDVDASPVCMLPANTSDTIVTLGYDYSAAIKAIEEGQRFAHTKLYGQIDRNCVECGEIGFNWYLPGGKYYDRFNIKVGKIQNLDSDLYSGRLDFTTNQTYHYRAYCIPANSTDSIYGEWKTFTTPKALIKAETRPATGIVPNSAQLCGVVENISYSYISYYFEYGEDADLKECKKTKAKTGDVADDGSVSARISGLKPLTKYYYRLVVINGEDKILGEILEFETIDKLQLTVEEVDLGLSVNWASCNLYALSPLEPGGKFQWAEVLEGTDGTRYDNISGYGVSGHEWDDAKDDAARDALGDQWSVPTAEEVQELLDSCSYQILDKNLEPVTTGAYGEPYVKITGPNGNSIIFPSGLYWTEKGPILTDSYTDAWGNFHGLYQKAWAFSMPHRFYENGEINPPKLIGYLREYPLYIRPVKRKANSD